MAVIAMSSGSGTAITRLIKAGASAVMATIPIGHPGLLPRTLTVWPSLSTVQTPTQGQLWPRGNG